jgi:hypothetical protein
MREVYKDIFGYETYYKISNKGNVYSVAKLIYQPKRKIWKSLKGKQLKPYATKFGHLYITLYKDGKSETRYVHQIVYETFVGKIGEGLEIDHIDNNPANNNWLNLRAISHRRNVSLGHKKRLLPTGVYNNGKGKYYAQISNGKSRYSLGTFTTVEAASNMYQLKREEFEGALLRV